MNMKKRYYVFLILFCLFFGGVVSAQPQVPTGRPIQVTEILTIAENVGGFLRVLGGILVGITIILSGFVYFFAGSNQTRVKTAKDIFKAGVIGALIIFSVGIIIGTISGFATDPFQFFGGGGGGGGGNTYYDCVNGACIQTPGGVFLNDPTCQGTC